MKRLIASLLFALNSQFTLIVAQVSHYAQPPEIKKWNPKSFYGIPAGLRRAAFLFALFSMLSTMSGCGEEPVTFKYRLTLEIFCDGELHSGTGVIKISSWIASAFPNPGTTAQGVTIGQAIMVDLGKRGLLFALLRGPQEMDNGSASSAEALPFLAFRNRIPISPNYLDEWRIAAGMIGATGELRISQLPMLVMFKNIDEPTTVERVDPEHLETMLGPDARIDHATIEITDAPVTMGIENTLNWLTKLRGLYLDGDDIQHFGARATLPNTLGTGDFLIKGKS